MSQSVNSAGEEGDECLAPSSSAFASSTAPLPVNGAAAMRAPLSVVSLSAALSRDNAVRGFGVAAATGVAAGGGSGVGGKLSVSDALLGKRRAAHRSAFSSVAVGPTATSVAEHTATDDEADAGKENDSAAAAVKRARADSPNATSTAHSRANAVAGAAPARVQPSSFSFLPPSLNRSSPPALHYSALSSSPFPSASPSPSFPSSSSSSLPSPSRSPSCSPSPSSPFSSLLCVEELPAELLSSAVSPLCASEWGDGAVASMASDYERLLDRCYALSCLRVDQQHDSFHSRLVIRALEERCEALQQSALAAASNSDSSSSSHTAHTGNKDTVAAQPAADGGGAEEAKAGESGSVDTDGIVAGWVLSDCSAAVRRLLSEGVHVGRLCSSHRRRWFDLLERRVQQRDERMVALINERAAEREQWRNKQRALEHEVSRLRIELQLNQAAAAAAAGKQQLPHAMVDGNMAVAH